MSESGLAEGLSGGGGGPAENVRMINWDKTAFFEHLSLRCSASPSDAE